MKEFVLITPAKNEEKYIELTLKSVTSQTQLPLKWVIVNDGSTDSTRDIILRYREKFSFIHLLDNPQNAHRNFGHKAHAFNSGYKILSSSKFSFVGNLDADVSFDNDYFEQLLMEFNKNPKLGLAGGLISELLNNKYVDQLNSSNSVAGAAQFFRRDCFESFGGYLPLPYGGIDTNAEINARMKGWEVQTFEKLKVLHHRPVSRTGIKLLKSKFQYGITHYLLGYHPLFLITSSLMRALRRPIFVGSILRILGYYWAKINKYHRPVSKDFIKFIYLEQKSRLFYLANKVKSKD